MSDIPLLQPLSQQQVKNRLPEGMYYVQNLGISRSKKVGKKYRYKYKILFPIEHLNKEFDTHSIELYEGDFHQVLICPIHNRYESFDNKRMRTTFKLHTIYYALETTTINSAMIESKILEYFNGDADRAIKEITARANRK